MLGMLDPFDPRCLAQQVVEDNVVISQVSEAPSRQYSVRCGAVVSHSRHRREVF